MLGIKHNAKVIIAIVVALFVLLVVLLVVYSRKGANYTDYISDGTEVYFDDNLYTRDDITDEYNVVSNFAVNNGITGVVSFCINSDQDEPDPDLEAAGYDNYYMVYNMGDIIIIVVDDGVPIIFK